MNCTQTVLTRVGVDWLDINKNLEWILEWIIERGRHVWEIQNEVSRTQKTSGLMLKTIFNFHFREVF